MSATARRGGSKPSPKPRGKAVQSANGRGNALMLSTLASGSSTKSSRTTVGKSLILAKAETGTSREPDEGFVKYLRDAPFYHHPFIGCKTASIQLAGTAISWSGVVWNLATSITQGVADNQRTGDVIRLLGASVLMRTSQGSAAAISANSEYQLAVVYSPISTIGVSSVFQDTGTQYSGVSPPDWDYSAVMKRIRHKVSFLDVYHPMRVHDMSFHCDELINYDAGATTIATGALSIVAISGENPAAATEVPTGYGMVQLYYQDV